MLASCIAHRKCHDSLRNRAAPQKEDQIGQTVEEKEETEEERQKKLKHESNGGARTEAWAGKREQHLGPVRKAFKYLLKAKSSTSARRPNRCQ